MDRADGPLATTSYTDCVATRLTITVSEEVPRWVREKAVEENLSVSQTVEKILKSRLAYCRVYERWKTIDSLHVDAAGRLSRDDAHIRRFGTELRGSVR